MQSARQLASVSKHLFLRALIPSDHSAHALVCEQLQKYGVMLSAIYDMGLFHTVAHDANAGFHLGNHSALDDILRHQAREQWRVAGEAGLRTKVHILLYKLRRLPAA